LLYGMGGPGIESLWEQDFPHASRPSLGPTTYLSIQWEQSFFNGDKTTGELFWPPTPFSAYVKERVEIISTPLLGLHCLCKGWNLPWTWQCHKED